MEVVDRVKKLGQDAVDLSKKAFQKSNEWILSPPQRPSNQIYSMIQRTFSPITGAGVVRLEYLIAPKTFLITFWCIVMAIMGMTVMRMAKRQAPGGMRDSLLLVLTLTGLVYHLTWAVYRWQDLFILPVLSRLQ